MAASLFTDQPTSVQGLMQPFPQFPARSHSLSFATLASTLLAAKTDAALLKANLRDVTVTWIGHSTALWQLNGLNILTDPHFSTRASPETARQ